MSNFQTWPEPENDSIKETSAAQERKLSLVLAAYELIAEKGFEGLRTREVAARTGMNTATLHYYFPTKEALIRGVADYLMSQFRTVRSPASPAWDSPPVAQLDALFADVQYRVREVPQMQVVLYELFLRSVRDPAVREVVQALDSAWQGYIEAILHTGIQQGIFRPEIDPQAIALLIMALIKGGGIQSLTNPAAFDFDLACEVIKQTIML